VLSMIERKNSEVEDERFIIKIMGDEYVVKGKDSPQYKQEIAAYLEEVIENISKSNLRLNKCQTAVLAALKIADELQKLRQDYKYLEQLLKEAK
jgi:cell division protein ZapA